MDYKPLTHFHPIGSIIHLGEKMVIVERAGANESCAGCICGNENADCATRKCHKSNRTDRTTVIFSEIEHD